MCDILRVTYCTVRFRKPLSGKRQGAGSTPSLLHLSGFRARGTPTVRKVKDFGEKTLSLFLVARPPVRAKSGAILATKQGNAPLVHTTRLPQNAAPNAAAAVQVKSFSYMNKKKIGIRGRETTGPIGGLQKNAVSKKTERTDR